MGKMSMVEFRKEMDHMNDIIYKYIVKGPTNVQVVVHTLAEILHLGPLAATIGNIPEGDQKLSVLDEKFRTDFTRYYTQTVNTWPASDPNHPTDKDVERMNAYKKYLATRVPEAK